MFPLVGWGMGNAPPSHDFFLKKHLIKVDAPHLKMKPHIWKVKPFSRKWFLGEKKLKIENCH